MRPERSFRQTIEFAGPDILLELPIPELSVKPREPLAKDNELLDRKRADPLFDVLDSGHSVASRLKSYRRLAPLATRPCLPIPVRHMLPP